MTDSMFRSGLRPHELPDIGLSLLLGAAARLHRDEVGDDAVADFIRRLCLSMRRDADGEVTGEADAAGLTAADRAAVTACLVAALDRARGDQNPARLPLAHIVSEWTVYARSRRA